MSTGAETKTETRANAALGRVRDAVAREGDPSRRAEAFVLALADAVKATSNDQNVQRLSRDLRAAASDLVACLAPERV